MVTLVQADRKTESTTAHFIIILFIVSPHEINSPNMTLKIHNLLPATAVSRFTLDNWLLQTFLLLNPCRCSYEATTRFLKYRG